MGEGNHQEQISEDSNIPEDEGGSDQGEVMYEDDVLEEIDDEPSPENGLRSCSFVLIILPFGFIARIMADLRAELEDLDMEAGDDDGGGGGFVPLRDDAVQCFKEHAGIKQASQV